MASEELVERDRQIRARGSDGGEHPHWQCRSRRSSQQAGLPMKRPRFLQTRACGRNSMRAYFRGVSIGSVGASPLGPVAALAKWNLATPFSIANDAAAPEGAIATTAVVGAAIACAALPVAEPTGSSGTISSATMLMIL
ncbi:MAG: hypothetical protein ACREXI_04595, partial [Caldimonas sp.]